jgi:hypothetical protein
LLKWQVDTLAMVMIYEHFKHDIINAWTAYKMKYLIFLIPLPVAIHLPNKITIRWRNLFF